MSNHKQPNAQWENQIDYDNAEFTLATGQSDYDVATNETNAFSNIADAKYISIRTNQTIIVKLNSTSNNSVTITSSDSPFIIKHDESGLIVDNIYISNASGSTAAIKILLY